MFGLFRTRTREGLGVVVRLPKNKAGYWITKDIRPMILDADFAYAPFKNDYGDILDLWRYEVRVRGKDKIVCSGETLFPLVFEGRENFRYEFSLEFCDEVEESLLKNKHLEHGYFYQCLLMCHVEGPNEDSGYDHPRYLRIDSGWEIGDDVDPIVVEEWWHNEPIGQPDQSE